MAPIDGMTYCQASASMPPGSQPDSRSHEKPASASAAGPRSRSTARRSPAGTASRAAAAASTGSRSGVGHGVVVVATVEQPAEERRLAVVTGLGVGQLDDVGHADLAREAVVAQGRPLVVEPADGVGHAPLDRHGEVAAMRRQPVADQLGRLVGTLQDAGDNGAATGAAGGDVLGGHDHRGRAHAHRLPQVRGQAGDEGRVGGGDVADQVDEAAVAVGGALVERVLADHVGGGQQEQLRLGVAQVGAPPSWVRVRRPSVRTGAVTLARSGRRRVPENLDMVALLSAVGGCEMVRSGNTADERCRVERRARGFP